MACNLAEVLEHNVDNVQCRKTKELGQYVSDQLTSSYVRLSSTIYEIKREIVVVPLNHEEILRRFNSDVNVYVNDGFTLTHHGLTTNLTVPLVVLAELGTEKKKIASEGITMAEYEVKSDPDRNKPIIFGNHHGSLTASYGKQEISLKGKWTYNGKIESVEVKVPKLPEQSTDVSAEAQLRYFQILTEAKKTKNFSGQTLPQPELYIVWIPRQEDFEVKVEEMEIVHPDPALILRVDKKHDHVISLWHTETEEPLEFLVRRHTE